MAAYLSLGEALAAVAAGASFSLVLGAGWWAFNAYRTGRMRRGWRWLRVQALDGVTTLEHRLGYNCTVCQHSLDAREKVRKLSCGHVFHSRGTEKCNEGIEKWLCETSMTCPICREIPRIVWPWKARVPAPTSDSSGSLPRRQRGRRRTRGH